jgi:flagellar basal body-associated protein FliL
MEQNNGEPNTKKSKKKIVLIIAGVIVGLCLLCLVFGLFLQGLEAVGLRATRTPKPTLTNTTEPTSTNTPEPTQTITPTFTPTITSTPEPTKTEEAYDKYLLTIVTEDVIKMNLVSPSTAEFPGPLQEWTIIDTENSVIVSSYVDSENAFGAMVRNTFTVEYSLPDIEVIYIEISGEVIYEN